MKKILLLTATVLALSISSIQAQNLLTNPGFETWALSGTNNIPTSWTINTPATISQNTILYNEGTKACKVTASGTVNISQQVAVTAGKTYSFKISYYYELTTGNGIQIRSYFKTATGRAKMTLDDSLALNGPGGNALYFPKVAGAWKTYTYDVVDPANATAFVFYIAIASTSVVTIDNCGFTLNTTPTLYPSVTSLTGFNYAPGAGPSTEQSLKVRASNLTGDMTVTTSGNFEVSVGTGTLFDARSPITIANSAGLISSMPLYVRLKSGLAVGTYTGLITLSAVGATTQYIALTASVAVPPVVITPTVTTLPAFTYAQGSGPSAQQTFSVSGTGLTAGVVVTAPTGYEISLASGTYTGASTFTLPQTGGVLALTPIYIRLKSGLTSGTYNGNVSLASTGGTTKTVSLTGSVTLPLGITVTPTSLTGFSYGLGAGPSPVKSFNLTYSGASAFIIVTTPSGFEIASSASGSYSNYLVLAAGTLNATVYVRLQTGYPVATYTGNISLSCSTYTGQVSVNGNVLMTTFVQNPDNSSLRVYSSGNEIIVEGTSAKETISVYNLVGMHIKSINSTGEKLNIPVKTGAVYLVKTATKTVKVIM